MVATGLGSIILAAVFSAFIFITRACISLTDYSEMEAQARESLETFAQDVRMASAVHWNSTQSITLTVEQAGAPVSVTYHYNPVRTSSAPAATFTRTAPDGQVHILLTGIRSFAFSAFSITTAAVPLTSLSAADGITKQIQISLETERQRSSLALSTNKVISARFVLRNKRVTA